MKKLLFALAAVAALAFTACETKPADNNVEAADSVAAFSIENFDAALAQATDSLGVDSLLNQANAEVVKLIDAGNDQGAADLLAQIKQVIEKNAEKIKAFMPGIIEFAAAKTEALNLKPEVKALVDSAFNKLKASAAETVAEGVDAAKDAAADVKDAAKEGVEAAADAAKDGVDAAKDAAAKVVK